MVTISKWKTFIKQGLITMERDGNGNSWRRWTRNTSTPSIISNTTRARPHHMNREPCTTRVDDTNTINLEPRERRAHGLATTNAGTNTMDREPPERRAQGLAMTNGVKVRWTNEPRAHEHQHHHKATDTPQDENVNERDQEPIRTNEQEKKKYWNPKP